MILSPNQHIVVEELNQQIEPVSEISRADLKENQINADSHTSLRFGYDGKQVGSILIPRVKNNFSAEDQELFDKVMNFEPLSDQDQALVARGGTQELPKMDEQQIDLAQSVIKRSQQDSNKLTFLEVRFKLTQGFHKIVNFLDKHQIILKAYHKGSQNELKADIANNPSTYVIGGTEAFAGAGLKKHSSSKTDVKANPVLNCQKNQENEKVDSYNIGNVIKQLANQQKQKTITVEVGDQTYTIKQQPNNSLSLYEASDNLATAIYESVRNCDTDICDIAGNLNFKPENIKNVKDHIFYATHLLDKYANPGEIVKPERFNPDVAQALAWKRLENGHHTPEDITWLKHEIAERHHELKFNSGYKDAHNRAQSKFDGYPWPQPNWEDY